MTHRLSPAQVQFYREQGYLLFGEPVFAPRMFAELKEHIESRFAAWTEALGKPLDVIDWPHFVDPKLNEWLLADEVLDLVEPLVGPDIALFACSFLTKLPLAARAAPWHEDASYWTELADRIEGCTLWLAIDHSVVENGCMRVIPGSHQERNRLHGPVDDRSRMLLDRQVDPGTFDELDAVDCILEPNTCSLHDAYTIHGSRDHTGTTRRCGFQMRYVPTTVKALNGHRMYLARGRDHAGNDYGDPTKVNERRLENNPQKQMMARISEELG